MPEDFPDLKSGDEIEPRLFNIIYKELRRWRKAKGDGMVRMVSADSGTEPPRLSLGLDREFFIQLTGSYSSGYPWQEVQIVPGGSTELTGVTGSIANDPAFERRTGDTTLTSGSTVYRARRSPASGEVVFPHLSTGPPPISLPGCPCTSVPAILTLTILPAAGSFCGTTNDGAPSSMTLTATSGFSTFDGNGVTGGNVWLSPVFAYNQGLGPGTAQYAFFCSGTGFCVLLHPVSGLVSPSGCILVATSPRLTLHCSPFFFQFTGNNNEFLGCQYTLS